ncbi:MAG: hypothetical protein LBJ25_02265 [Candidatus Margulisbacteria bacterium]|nr:hypothetical protein [Candidatus Margulisiibacteriota bacterium]
MNININSGSFTNITADRRNIANNQQINNNDGFWTESTSKKFGTKEIDSNQDGQISLDEFSRMPKSDQEEFIDRLLPETRADFIKAGLDSNKPEVRLSMTNILNKINNNPSVFTKKETKEAVRQFLQTDNAAFTTVKNTVDIDKFDRAEVGSTKDGKITKDDIPHLSATEALNLYRGMESDPSNPIYNELKNPEAFKSLIGQMSPADRQKIFSECLQDPGQRIAISISSEREYSANGGSATTISESRTENKLTYLINAGLLDGCDQKNTARETTQALSNPSLSDTQKEMILESLAGQIENTENTDFKQAFLQEINNAERSGKPIMIGETNIRNYPLGDTQKNAPEMTVQFALTGVRNEDSALVRNTLARFDRDGDAGAVSMQDINELQKDGKLNDFLKACNQRERTSVFELIRKDPGSSFESIVKELKPDQLKNFRDHLEGFEDHQEESSGIPEQLKLIARAEMAQTSPSQRAAKATSLMSQEPPDFEALNTAIDNGLLDGLPESQQRTILNNAFNLLRSANAGSEDKLNESQTALAEALSSGIGEGRISERIVHEFLAEKQKSGNVHVSVLANKLAPEFNRFIEARANRLAAENKDKENQEKELDDATRSILQELAAEPVPSSDSSNTVQEETPPETPANLASAEPAPLASADTAASSRPNIITEGDTSRFTLNFEQVENSAQEAGQPSSPGAAEPEEPPLSTAQAEIPRTITPQPSAPPTTTPEESTTPNATTPFAQAVGYQNQPAQSVSTPEYRTPTNNETIDNAGKDIITEINTYQPTVVMKGIAVTRGENNRRSINITIDDMPVLVTFDANFKDNLINIGGEDYQVSGINPVSFHIDGVTHYLGFNGQSWTYGSETQQPTFNVA